MATDQTRIAILFQRYADKTASPEETSELFALAAAGSFDQELNALLLQRLNDTDSVDDYDHELWAGVLAKVKDDIDAIEHPIALLTETPKRRRFGFAKFAVAAAVATIVFGAGLFYYYKRNQDSTSQQVKLQDVAPGKQGATLTLASGRKIRLADAGNGELAKEAGVVISKTADGQIVYKIQSSTSENKINTISTAKGETYRLRLPDGSLVWLNAASSLTYSANLIERGGRRVRLEGEAYFEIAKDKAHPFTVESKGQLVEVLGTHFNVSAYGDDGQTRTTLAEGSVKVTTAGLTKVLKPNQQAVVTDKGVQLLDVDAEYALAWKDGYFLFNDESLERVMDKIARWYNVEVEFKDESLRSTAFIGTISRFEKISEVFRMLERTDVATFTVVDRKVIIDKKK